MKVKLILISFCFFTISFSQINEYPNWFLYPKDFNFVVGFDSDIKKSEDDALLRFITYKKSFIVGNLLYSIGSEELEKQTEYNFIISNKMFKTYKGKLQLIDCFTNSIFENFMICAYALNVPKNTIIKTIRSNKLLRPEWIKNNSFEDGVYYYGVGEFTSQGNETYAWQTAEENSIISIAKMKKIKLTSLRVSLNDDNSDDFYSASKYTFKHSIEGIEILERFPDKENNIFYVLSRVKIKNIKYLEK